MPREQDYPCACSGSQPTRCDLIADAIASALYRFTPTSAETVPKGRSSVPFLIKFLDHLLLALPESTEVAVTCADADYDRWITTKPGCFRSTIADVETHSTFDIDPIRFAFESPKQHGADTATDPRRILARVFESLDFRDSTLRGAILQWLNDGLNTVLEGRRSEPSVCEPTAPTAPSTGSPRFGDEALVRNTVRRIQNTLAEVLTPLDTEYTVVLRYWAQGAPHLQGFHCCFNSDDRVVEPTRPETMSAWKNDLERTFQSHFLRNAGLPDGNLLLCIPCHFGGVPWFVVCREIERDPRDWWQSYATYRDLVPSLMYSLRSQTAACIAAEMQRHFLEAVADFHVDPDETRRAIEQSWANLISVFPIRRPCFQEISGGNDDMEHALRLGNRDWKVVFASESSPLFDSRLALESKRTEHWGTIETTVLRQGFLAPMLSELRKQQARRGTDLATSVYKIGHPLKDRVGPVRSSINTIRYDLEEGEPRESIVGLVDAAGWELERVERLGHIMDIISRAVSEASAAATFLNPKKPEWRADTPYVLAARIGELAAYVNRFEPKEISLDWRLPKGTTQLAIATWIDSHPKQVRPSDLLYNELFSEILLNASRHGATNDAGVVDLAIEICEAYDDVSGAHRTCLTFRNVADRPDDLRKVGLVSEQWRRWDPGQLGSVGGIMLLALVLRETGTGLVFSKMEEEGNATRFAVALWLQGLEQE